jgi:hypothetical protein
MAAYLDTNIFDRLYGKIGCTGADIASLRKKIYGRELSIPLSIHTLEEILLDRRARPELRVAKTKLTLSLGNYRRMVKPWDQLLSDDLLAYAATGEAGRAFIDTDLQNIITDGISELIETDGEELDEDMIEALEESKRRGEKFRTAIGALLGDLKQPEDPVAESFLEFFEATGVMLAEKFAEHQGLFSECQQRGVDGLLRIKSVRMLLGATLSCQYGSTVSEPQSACGSIDLRHAVSAAAVAKTLVTEGSELRRVLARVPIDDFEVVDLRTFLQTVA